jgi:hypothetical protein
MPIEVSVWLTGRETPNQIEAFKKDCTEEVTAFGVMNNVVMGTPIFTEKKPGEDRVPQVPMHIHGPDVRMLVCEALIVAERAMIVKSSGFVQDLDPKDLAKLREITRRAHQKARPIEMPLTDAQCDAIIEQIGPTSALRSLGADFGSGTVN